MITNADFRRRSSQALAAMAPGRRGSAVAARGHGNEKTHPRLQPRAGHVVRKTLSTGILPWFFRDVNTSPPEETIQWMRHGLIDRKS